MTQPQPSPAAAPAPAHQGFTLPALPPVKSLVQYVRSLAGLYLIVAGVVNAPGGHTTTLRALEVAIGGIIQAIDHQAPKGGASPS